jgi:predicted dehydrogenase
MMNETERTNSGEPIRIAILGMGTRGHRVLGALQQSPEFTVVAVTDRDATRAEQGGTSANAPGFTDTRSMFSQTQPEAVCLTTPPMVNADHVATCAQRGVHVWKLAPLARNLREAATMVRQMHQSDLTFMVGTYRRFMEPYRRASHLRPHIGALQLARAEYLFNWGPLSQWRSDRSASGGGALMELGYHFVDLLLWTLGFPEDVFSIAGVSSHNALPAINDRPGQIPSDTDDTAAAVLRFPNGAMGSLVTSRVHGPIAESLALHGHEGSIVADPKQLILRDPDGGLREDFSVLPGPFDGLTQQLRALARAIRSNDGPCPCSATENLLTMATVEAMYLSQKTGQAENPGELLKMVGFTTAECTPPPEDIEPLPDMPVSDE